MNRSIIRYVLGNVLKIEGMLMLPAFIVSLIYRERNGIYFLATAAVIILVGSLLSYRKPENDMFYLREGCIITALSWVFLSFFGALPFWFSGEIPSLVDAVFETVSGFTTTGASILTDVEALSKCSLFWRSFTHWIGGMGVLVFILAIVPMSGGSHINLMRAESPGPSVGKLVPRIKTTAQILYFIYIVLTLSEIIILIIGRMPVFDAITLSFGTAGTGGFGILNSSIGSYTVFHKWVITIFMTMFGVNFNAYYAVLLSKKVKSLFSTEEVRHYLGIILIATTIIFLNIRGMYDGNGKALTDAAFQVSSIITTTGYSTADFDLWPSVSKTILVMLMFCGACAGSTGGGIKVSRILILRKTILKEFGSYIHPKSVKKIQMDEKPVDHDVVRSVNVFFATIVIVFALSVFLISLENKDLVTNFTAVAATLNNIGPGLSLVGPTQNFSFFNDFSKLILMFDMLAGRLELFPMLILFTPGAYRNK